MIADAHARGVEAALAHFQVKKAGITDWAIRGAKGLGFFGQGPEAFVQGAKAFHPGGALHWKNVLWPSIPGSPIRTWGGRLGTLGAAAMIPGMMRRDEGEGAASKFLGAAGGLAGMMYGGTAGGWLGGSAGMALGRGVGHGIGHMIGSKPEDPYQ